MVIGMIGAFCFIIFQVVLLVDFAHRWNEWWLVATIAIYNMGQVPARVLGSGLIKKLAATIIITFR